MSRQGDTQTLVESFCTLADEVQNLIDRKTILEHKLRFAAEQVSVSSSFVAMLLVFRFHASHRRQPLPCFYNDEKLLALDLESLRRSR